MPSKKKSNNKNTAKLSINNKTFLKRLTIIVEKNIIKKVFYPVVSVNKHIENILKWLQEN